MFDEIKAGLKEAVEYEKGNVKARTRTRSISSSEECADSAFTTATQPSATRNNINIIPEE